MARFIVSISLLVVLSNSLFVFSQKYEPIQMCMLVDETTLLENTEAVTSPMTVNIYSNFNSNYLTLEVHTPKAIPFQLVSSSGEEVYSGTISGTQLIETESWPVGTYYFVSGTKRERIYITR
ncbi:MAG: hypothetical protein ACO1N0_15710 [Fluviicola sp.]